MTDPRTVGLTREERLERADKELIRLCNGRDRSFRMTIPVDMDRDSDMLIGDGLNVARELLAALASDPEPDGLRAWVAGVRAKFRLPETTTLDASAPNRYSPNDAYWIGYSAAVADLERAALAQPSNPSGEPR